MNDILRDIVRCEHGVGPLLQRDYYGVIEEARERPVALMSQVRERFCEFAPAELVQFVRGGGDGRLDLGDELRVTIRGVGECGVRVVCIEDQSLTLATLRGHPEAGRITFGAYRNDVGDVVFHIRSRARASSMPFAMGYVAAGEAMQTNAWVDFISAVALTFGNGVKGPIRAETTNLEDEDGASAEEDVCSPTFSARGD